MSQLILNKGVDNYRLGKLASKFYFGPYFLVVALIVFVALITIITLVFSTRQVTKGYVLKSLETDHQQLVRAQERNEMEISRVRSLNFIEASDKVASMRSPETIVFVEGDTAIASR